MRCLRSGVPCRPYGGCPHAAQPPRRPNPHLHGDIRDIKHVVVLMQENRSFDHYFGSLKGVRGFGDRSTITLPGGRRFFNSPPRCPVPRSRPPSTRGTSVMPPSRPTRSVISRRIRKPAPRVTVGTRTAGTKLSFSKTGPHVRKASHFAVYDNVAPDQALADYPAKFAGQYTVEASTSGRTEPAIGSVDIAGGRYDLTIIGPNRFRRHFTGDTQSSRRRWRPSTTTPPSVPAQSCYCG